MRRRTLLNIIALGAIFGFAALCNIRASAQVPAVNITVDENGNGNILSGSNNFSIPGVLVADPGPGGLGSALTYNLLGPPSLIAGDVLLLEPGNAEISDVIRFNPAGTAVRYPASLVFYSDNADGVDALADTGLPTSLYTNVVRISEVGAEGDNGAFYTPGPDNPGFVAGFDVTYHFISDSPGSTVPEPGSVALFAGLGVSSLFAVRGLRRRKK